MKSSPIFGLLALVLLTGSLMWVRHTAQVTEKSETALLELERIFQSGTPVKGGTDEDDLLKFLLQYRHNHTPLSELAEANPKLVIRPERSQAFFIHKRSYDDNARDKDCLCVVTDESGGWNNHTSHAGYPHYLQLHSLELDGETLISHGKILDDLDWEPVINGVSVKAGQELRFEVDVSSYRPMPISEKALGPPIF